MKITLIGSGNVATHLARALSLIESIKLEICSRNAASGISLAQALKVKFVQDLKSIDFTSDFVILAVKDDAIPEVLNSLIHDSGYLKANHRSVFLHTSGAIPLTVFEGKVNNFGVFYPLQTFSKNKDLIFSEVPLFIEANSSSNLSLIQDLAAKLVSKTWVLDSEQRKILHLAAVFACNFTNHLYALSQALLENADLSFDMIKPLIMETADKIKLQNPLDVQTGPAKRNDVITMHMHQDMLANNEDMLAIYQILSDSIKNTNK
ncbi:MAG: DUF2520 domain-containing protein [Pedobacter sp.]|nr:MAG: DUF2520 domain-containing protein [Pedobacter sp.]